MTWLWVGVLLLLVAACWGMAREELDDLRRQLLEAELVEALHGWAAASSTAMARRAGWQQGVAAMGAAMRAFGFSAADAVRAMEEHLQQLTRMGDPLYPFGWDGFDGQPRGVLVQELLSGRDGPWDPDDLGWDPDTGTYS